MARAVDTRPPVGTGPREGGGERTTRARRAGAFAAWAAVGAAVAWLLVGTGFANYDAAYSLVWGRDLARGQLPNYDVPVSPTPTR